MTQINEKIVLPPILKVTFAHFILAIFSLPLDKKQNKTHFLDKNGHFWGGPFSGVFGLYHSEPLKMNFNKCSD